MDKLKIEYRLDFKEDKFDKYIETIYFDTVNDVYNYITNNKLTTFRIIKEELIANRVEG